ncbi:exo-beta-1,4-galactosidase [Flavobacterium sp. WC2509]|uniref:exo-beta-1,4-galactosidase n=1 Tax=Flavobacterium sp. WC2509 TaxID=3461406 RepID=UPI0040447524
MLSKTKLLLFISLLFFSSNIGKIVAQTRDTIHLEGQWSFQEDAKDQGVNEKWFSKKLKETIALPGSMTTNGKGNDITIKTEWTGSIYDSSFYFNPRFKKYREPKPKFPFWLTPKKRYVGAAWYQKEVIIPNNWQQKHISLFLERPHTETVLWVDGQKVGMQNSMVSPHEYELSSLLTPGKHTLTICVDNRIKDINVGIDSHSLTDHTQGNWNGIIGKIKLISTSSLYVDNIQAYPDLANKQVQLVIALAGIKDDKYNGTLNIFGNSFNSAKKNQIKPINASYSFTGKNDTIKVNLPMGNNFLTWDEFDPALYKLKIELTDKKSGKDVTETQFGMRDFKAKGRSFIINGRPVFLRGTVDNAVFPLTAYPDMSLSFWVRIFKVIKDHGLNHVRYHSWSPPEAAFKAADLAGVYLQPEGPSWANHGSSIGNGKPIDKFIYDETNRMEKYYGNYASYCMLAYGNEPRGNQVKYLTEFNNYWIKKDSRRLYTGASVGGSWPVIDNNEFMVRGGARDLDWKRATPFTTDDFTKAIEKFNVPFVAHEMGQYCVFPNFDEIKKYKGVLEALNFELFQEDLKDHHMASQAHDFFMASGKLQALSYKFTMEKALRTPDYAGYQLLSLNDYPGQGTALVGILDPFWDPKPYINNVEFKEYSNSTVPLAEIKKFVYTNDESFSAAIEISHFGKEKLNKNINWKITSENGNVFKKGTFPSTEINFGLNKIGAIEAVELNSITVAQKLTFTVAIEGTSFKNHWEFWVYPKTLPEIKSEVYYTDILDTKAEDILKSGGKVYLNLAGKVVKGKEVVQTFLPVFWNTSWFQMKPPHTLGIVVDPKNPVFKDFPTEYHSNLQWWSILNNTQVMNLEDFPDDFKPLVQPIDTWFMNRRLANFFEVKVGKGKLLVSSVDLNNAKKDAASKQLFYSIQKYMNSDAFNPKTEIDLKLIQNILTEESREQFKKYSKDSPDELKPKSSLITK